MTNKKLKYIEFLTKIKNCPADDYFEFNGEAFRWIHQEEHENDFKPVNLINEPPQRILDDSDKLCIGYGLSLFDTLENANSKYKKEYTKRREHQRESFVINIGNCIATLGLENTDGIANQPVKENHGHFTFHEYENTDLRSKIKSIYNIFAYDGKFVN